MEREAMIRAANLAAIARLDGICFVLPDDKAASPAQNLHSTLKLSIPSCFGYTRGTEETLTLETLNNIHSLCGTTPTASLVTDYGTSLALTEAIKADVERSLRANDRTPLAISIPNDPAEAPLFAARLRYLRSATAPFILLMEWEKVIASKESALLRLVEECARSTWAPPPAETNDAALGQLLEEVGRLCASPKETEPTAATALPFTGRKRWLHSLSNLIRSSPTLHRQFQRLYHCYRAITTPSKLGACSAQPLIPSFEVDRRSNTARVAVVVHAFYADLLSDLENTLRRFTEPFDLYVTTPHRKDIPIIERTLAPVTPHIVIATTENRGRDIGPFLALFRTGAFAPYKAVLKLHLKKSLYSKKGDVWRNALYEQLCPDGVTIQRAIQLLESGNAGVIGPHNFYLSHPKFWGANRAHVRAIRHAIGNADIESEELGFFAGSMFWFKPEALCDIHQLPESLLSFDPEAGQQDGTLAHAFERVVTELAIHAGHRTTSLELDGEEIRNRTELRNNTVPVM
jgi:hypothetical protein